MRKHRILKAAVCMALSAALLTACEQADPLAGISGEADRYAISSGGQAAEPVTFGGTYEFEDGAVLGGAAVESEAEGFSGTGYVTDFKDAGDGAELTVAFEQSGRYDFTFVTASEWKYKENTVFLDDESIGKILTEDEEGWQEYTIKSVYVEEGEHRLSVMKEWGWINLDCVRISPGQGIDPASYEVQAELINPNADENARRLMRFLADAYGDYVISGQYNGSGKISAEFSSIYEITGRYPAMCGFDLIEYSPSRVAFGSGSMDVENAIRWWEEEGGIVTFCWHWNAPEKYLINSGSNPWWKGFYTEATTIDLAKIMSGEDPEGYDLLLSDIDAIAKQLQLLEDAGVPVLWRPLHEASGAWFWWGASGPEPYVALWKLLYERLTEYHKLNNLIWVWNGQSGDWYPGDSYVDIIGEDIYPPEHDYSSQLARFNQAADYTGATKIIALTENGVLPDPELIFRDGNIWAWFCTWEGEFVVDADEYSEQYTEKSMLEKVYNHAKVITLDELPNIKKYPLK